MHNIDSVRLGVRLMDPGRFAVSCNDFADEGTPPLVAGSSTSRQGYNTEGNLWVEVTIPLLVFTYATFVIRIWWSNKVAGRLTASDICILVSLLCCTIQEVLGCKAILKWGLGHHAAYLGPLKTQKALMYFYTYQVFYKTVVGATKMSFIFLYLDLFPIKWFTWTCRAVNASIILAVIAFDAATIFQCTPIQYFWNRTIKSGHCVNVPAFWYGHAAWNTVADMMILLLPVPVIRSLQMGVNQKFAVAGVFGLGAFVIVASVLRMIALDPASKTTQQDMTYVISTSNAFLWTQVEASVAIICACLPTLKGPLMKLAPHLFSSLSKNRSTNNVYNLESRSKTGDTGTWNERYFNRSMRKGDDAGDDASSQERIIGITKTVGVDIVSVPADEERKLGYGAGERDIFKLMR